MTCENCGALCRGTYCKECERLNKQESAGNTPFSDGGVDQREFIDGECVQCDWTVSAAGRAFWSELRAHVDNKPRHRVRFKARTEDR